MTQAATHRIHRPERPFQRAHAGRHLCRPTGTASAACVHCTGTDVGALAHAKHLPTCLWGAKHSGPSLSRKLPMHWVARVCVRQTFAPQCTTQLLRVRSAPAIRCVRWSISSRGRRTCAWVSPDVCSSRPCSSARFVCVPQRRVSAPGPCAASKIYWEMARVAAGNLLGKPAHLPLTEGCRQWVRRRSPGPAFSRGG